MEIVILKDRIEKLKYKLDIAENKLRKATPHKPLVNDERKYDSKKKELIHRYSYFCSYCGEQIRLNTKKHKCGQIHDWN